MLVALWATFENTGSSNFALGKAVIFGMFFYGFGYGGFMNTFFPTYCGEIMPTNIRATGTATGYALFNLIVILLVQVTPMAIEAISWKYFMIFVICDVVFIIIFILFFPETKNKTLEEIGALFGDEVCRTYVRPDRGKANEYYFSLARRWKRQASMWKKSYTNMRSVQCTSTRSRSSMYKRSTIRVRQWALPNWQPTSAIASPNSRSAGTPAPKALVRSRHSADMKLTIGRTDNFTEHREVYCTSTMYIWLSSLCIWFLHMPNLHLGRRRHLSSVYAIFSCACLYCTHHSNTISIVSQGQAEEMEVLRNA